MTLARQACTAMAPVFYQRQLGWSKNEKSKPVPLVLSFDYDSTEDYELIPELVELFDDLDLPASHAIIGTQAIYHSDYIERLLDRSDELVNHSMIHADVTPDKLEIATCHDAVQSTFGYDMCGC